MSTRLDPPHSPPGHGDSSDGAAAAEHSADIADMMATRAEAHAGRADDWATAAKDYAGIAETCSGTAGIRADCAAIDAERAVMAADRGAAASDRMRTTVAAIAMLACGVILGFVLSVVGYLAVVRVVHDTIGTVQERVVYDTRTLPAEVPMPSDKDAGPAGRDALMPVRDPQQLPR